MANAIPNRDTIEDYYNGDGPADAMGIPIAILKSLFINREPKPTRDQLTKLFTEEVFDNIFRHIERSKLRELIDMTWEKIDTIYQEAWKRPAYPEERVFICKFSFGWAREHDFWEIRPNDRKVVEAYIKGAPLPWD